MFLICIFVKFTWRILNLYWLPVTGIFCFVCFVVAIQSLFNTVQQNILFSSVIHYIVVDSVIPVCTSKVNDLCEPVELCPIHGIILSSNIPKQYYCDFNNFEFYGNITKLQFNNYNLKIKIYIIENTFPIFAQYIFHLKGTVTICATYTYCLTEKVCTLYMYCKQF